MHVGAPGVDVVSLRANYTDMYGDGQHFIPNGDPDARYYRASGTSMATPHVAGLAALIKAGDTTRDWISLKNLVLSGGEDIASMDGITITGKRINAYGALTCTDSSVFTVLNYPDPVEPGTATTVSALSINCESPVSPVTLSTCGEEVAALLDDGIDPDIAAGDGVFTASWTPSTQVNDMTFASPEGSESLSGAFDISFQSITPPSPTQLGNAVTMESAAIGVCPGDTVEYKFQADKPDSTVEDICGWQSQSSCVWNTTGNPPGMYTLTAIARVTGNPAEISTTASYELSTDQPVLSINDVAVQEDAGNASFK